MKRKIYLIEEENSTIALEISVNGRIEQGYEPIGGIGFDKINGRFLQALYLPPTNKAPFANTAKADTKTK